MGILVKLAAIGTIGGLFVAILAQLVEFPKLRFPGEGTGPTQTAPLQEAHYQTSSFVSGVPVRFELRFDGVPSQANVATLVEVSFRSDRAGRVQFRDVTLNGL